MKPYKTDRGFHGFTHEKYANENITQTLLIQESSAIGNYEDSFDNPGSSCLWVGKDHHLSRDDVKTLIEKMEYWLENKRLPTA